MENRLLRVVVGACLVALVLGGSPAPLNDGSTELLAGTSCRTILEDFPTSQDGIYWITTSSIVAPFQVYCDMTTDNGGWTLFYANAAASTLTTKLSYNTYLTTLPGIPVTTLADVSNEQTVGMIDFYLFQDHTSVMAKDIANWNANEFSTVEFSGATILHQFINHTLASNGTQACIPLPDGESFNFRNSNGASYAVSELMEWQGVMGYGWGDCLEQGIDQTTTSDVEDRPRHYIYARNGDTDLLRVRGIGGFNAGLSTAVARYFLR